MVFPLVIAVTAAILSITAGMYQSVFLQSSIHMALRQECGEISETVCRETRMDRFETSREYALLHPYLKIEEWRTYRLDFLFHDSVKKQEAGRYYLIDEAELVRIFTLSGEESN